MRLTRFSDIGLRVLIYLERAGERPHPVTVAEIATQFDIPLNHLVKVVGHLARAGWVRAMRGRNGGLRLSADPQVLTVQLRGVLKAGMRAFYAEMDRYTLARITEGGTGEQIVRMHKMFWSGTTAGNA